MHARELIICVGIFVCICVYMCVYVCMEVSALEFFGISQSRGAYRGLEYARELIICVCIYM
jgi:hypothetical protein